jgi:hypothetical protein
LVSAWKKIYLQGAVEGRNIEGIRR